MRARSLSLIPFLAVLASCANTSDSVMLTSAPVGTAASIETEYWNNLNRDGDIYFAGQPDLQGIHELRSRGIRTVVNIRTEPEMTAERIGFDEMTEVMRRGMEYIRIPVSSDTLSAHDADRLAAVLSRRSDPVVIHCGSSNRVGGLWALYLYRHRNVPLDEAIELGRAAGLRSDSVEQAVRRAVAESL